VFGPTSLGVRGKYRDRLPTEGIRGYRFDRQRLFAVVRRTQTLEEVKLLIGVRTDLELHLPNVPHDAGHLSPLCSLVEQRHLAQVVCGLGSSLTCTIAVRSIFEAGMPLGALGLLILLLLRLLVHGAVEVVLLARRWRT
jgi:hypothetical protein